MPERWERELEKLQNVDVDEVSARRRIASGPTGDGLPRRRDRIVAGLVAGALAVAATAFVWRLVPAERPTVGDVAAEPPVLTVSFHDSEVVPEGPDSSYRRVQTRISYGDARDESFTSTTPPNAIVEWVAAEDLTRFLPGPTIGSLVDFQADGEDARVLLGRPGDWPAFDRFTRIDRLPEEPGEYVLVFEADYPEGIARTARLVHLVPHGVVQLVATEGGEVGAALAHAYLDGRGTGGFLSQSEFIEGDSGVATTRERPDFDPGAWLEVPIEAPLGLASRVASAKIGSFESFDAFDPDAMTELGDLGTVVEGPAGRRLLALEVSWVHPTPDTGDQRNFEHALFFFPLEVVDTSVVEVSPAPAPVPSPAPTSDAVAIHILRSTEETSGAPRAVARFGEQEVGICPNGWRLVEPDGSSQGWVIMDCGQEEEFRAPTGTPIVTSGDFTSVHATARVSEEGARYASEVVPDIEPGSVMTLTYEVVWDDGSEASFWLLLTVSETPAAEEAQTDPQEPAAPALRVRCGPDGTQVLTTVVETQPDGLHVEPVDVPHGWSIGVTTEERLVSFWSGSSGVNDPFVRSVPTGDLVVVCREDGEGVIEESEHERIWAQGAPFRLVDRRGYFATFVPACEVSERTLVSFDFEQPDWSDPTDRIREELAGIEQADLVRRLAYPDPTVPSWWIVERDGRSIAMLMVKAPGSRLGFGVGWACSGSGVSEAGT